MAQQAKSHSARRQFTGTWADRGLTRPIRDTLGRYRIVKRLSAVFDVTLGPLAVVALVLLIVELLARLSTPWNTVVYASQLTIWGVFLAAFAVELSLAPRKVLYLRRNWFLVVALAVPALRIVRFASAVQFLRSARAVRGASVVRSFASVNRGLGAVQSFLGFSQIAYLGVLTALVWLAGSGLVYYLESTSDSGLDSAGDALWWGAAVLTTVGIQTEPVTGEGRFVAIFLRLFGVAVVGYFTARMAAYFFGSKQQETPPDHEEVRALRLEIAELREDLRSQRDSEDST